MKKDEYLNHFKGWYGCAEEQCGNCRNNKFRIFGFIYCGFEKKWLSALKLEQQEHCAAQHEKYRT